MKTIADADVIRLTNEHFIAIQVDSEARPDIGEPYSDWAWPATIFMPPDYQKEWMPRIFTPFGR